MLTYLCTYLPRPAIAAYAQAHLGLARMAKLVKVNTAKIRALDFATTKLHCLTVSFFIDLDAKLIYWSEKGNAVEILTLSLNSSVRTAIPLGQGGRPGGLSYNAGTAQIY